MSVTVNQWLRAGEDLRPSEPLGGCLCRMVPQYLEAISAEKGGESGTKEAAGSAALSQQGTSGSATPSV